VLHPELIQKHFATLMKVSDKNVVKRIMPEFLKTCSYVGYTDGLDIEKLT
jgi:hypothetical protein